MAAVVSEVEAPRRFNTGLITAFALGALLLAITGIYAVVAFFFFFCSLRTQEIAIRMALGHSAPALRAWFSLREELAFVGCILGILGPSPWRASCIVPLASAPPIH